MRAIRVHQFGGPEVLKLENVPEPKPGPGEVLLRVHAAGLNPVDTYIRGGGYAIKPPLPYTPGLDAAGVIEALGAGVSGWRVGDRVYTAAAAGSYAELALCKASDVYRLPERVSYEQGAAVGIAYMTAYRALFQRAAAQPSEIVLVHGASGGVGIATVQLARAAGLTVIGTAGSAEGLALVKAEGAHHALDHRAANFGDQLAAVAGGRGVDVIVEMLANVNLGKDLAWLAARGRVVVVGSRGPVEINPRDLMSREASIAGMILFGTPPADMAKIAAALDAGLENGTLRPVVGERFPLPEAAKAQERVMAPGAHGKIVLLP